MLNYLFPPVLFADRLLGLLLPFGLRIVLWGALSGLVAMGLYAWASDQDGLRALKRRMREIRKAMLRSGIEASEYMALSRENILCALRLLGKSLPPVLLSALPVVVVWLALATHLGYERPAPGTPLRVEARPPVALESVPPALSREESGAIRIAMPEAAQATVEIRAAGRLLYRGAPWRGPAPAVGPPGPGRLLWHNPAGALEPGAGIEALHFGFAPRRVLAGGGWLGSWDFWYFAALALAALALKFLRRID